MKHVQVTSYHEILTLCKHSSRRSLFNKIEDIFLDFFEILCSIRIGIVVKLVEMPHLYDIFIDERTYTWNIR